MKLTKTEDPAGDAAFAAARTTYILGVDVGSTVIRCHVYDKGVALRGSGRKQVEVLHPQTGWVEIDPECLWTQFVEVIKEAVQDAGIQISQVSALGISTQRATFITWNKKSGKPFHNFISWQDVRAAELVKSWNRSFLLKAMHGVSSLLHFFTRINLFLIASLLTFTTQHVSLRLAWVLQHISEVEQAAKDDNCCFGTIDTWLLYKLTKGAVYATDYSNASTTAFFDPFKLQWSVLLSKLFSIPISLFPPVEDTSHHFGSVDAEIFGVPFPITALVADQQAAMFGECCFDEGDIKITMGTGSFWDINTGSKIHVSRTGLYPLVGWKIGKELTYLAEANASDTGNAIKWAQDLDLFSSAEETSEMANSLVNSGGVCFVPSFSGLQIPVNDPCACTSFMGITPSTTKNHLVRAVLESIAFRNKQLYDTIAREVGIPPTSIWADGGVSKNSFIMQMTSDLINREINKSVITDMSCLGAAFLAGLAVGFWNDKQQLKKLRQTDVVFKPQKEPKEYELAMGNWIKAVKRSLHWYSHT
ncbi:putative glycerol kinase 5 isoform X1 [Hemicordylus capensis]|uniref:putative glycerol kinase 5 isoform X1 n=1 Tax=Hemicordylus capensis TaxID=884348 RepID=UPI0023043097|nr:putative glycerol kinase 5 isoform X1 [Hemicordylus capensis]